MSVMAELPTVSVSSPSASELPLDQRPATTVIDQSSSSSQTPAQPVPRPAKASAPPDGDENTWGANFWVTLVNPQTSTSFYACPATGQVCWDPPVGNFVLPPSADGEWWELTDESRGGLPYYYQTKTGETVWERPKGFVIPLGIIQNTALGRRLSNRFSKSFSIDKTASATGGVKGAVAGGQQGAAPQKPTCGRSKSYSDAAQHDDLRKQNYSRQSMRKSTQASPGPSPSNKHTIAMKRSFTNDQYLNSSHAHPSHPSHNGTTRMHTIGQRLPTIPSSASNSGASEPPTRAHTPRSGTPVGGSPGSRTSTPQRDQNGTAVTRPYTNGVGAGNQDKASPSRARSKSSSYVPRRSPQPQSLGVAIEMLTSKSASDSGHGQPPMPPSPASPTRSTRTSETRSSDSTGRTGTGNKSRSSTPERKKNVPPSPRRPIPALPNGTQPRGRNISAPVGVKGISGPIPNPSATMEMSPVKARAIGQPILVEPKVITNGKAATATLSSGTFPVLPQDLASDIQLFSESDYAKQYFSTHRTGFIFRRRVPVMQMMTWQKAPLSSPLLTVNRSLSKDAVRAFRVIQRIMGDRDRDKAPSLSGSTSSIPGTVNGVLEDERWLLGLGVTHGELRDEIYCQVMKQLTGNPSQESVFKGWQFLCVLLITFPPSKNFETYLSSFMQRHVSQQEGRVDIMAKYCIRRLAHISKKGPRGKPPSLTEIETASDAAFNPSTFGESLDAIFRLQERNYPHQKVPIILPFLADGILALGGTKSEGIFRVPGDGDSVSELKLRLDRGYYNLDGVDDPHTLASLMKLWLRELLDPLVPGEMYNECITSSKDPDACIRIVERLPTINRRVVLFVISFLQLFLEERTQTVTKMTPANLALVMAPNLLRCDSDSMSVVFTNAQYEQIFVYHLLLHLKCGEVDPDYTPAHGLGAVAPVPTPRKSKTQSRWAHQ